jgi:hypothetical protein
MVLLKYSREQSDENASARGRGEGVSYSEGNNGSSKSDAAALNPPNFTAPRGRAKDVVLGASSSCGACRCPCLWRAATTSVNGSRSCGSPDQHLFMISTYL